MDALTVIERYKLVPVVVFDTAGGVIPTLSALKKGGLPIAEITFRTACAADAISAAASEFPDMLIGAGTVINKKQCETAIACGAKFIVSPGFCREALEVCRAKDIPYIPGVVTPTEIIEAVSCGLTLLKFFPASDFGALKMIKALSAAFPEVRFMPTGGVTADNISEYLAFPKIAACGGSWMMKGTYDEIEKNTKEAMDIIFK